MTASAPEVAPVESATQPCPSCGAECKQGAKFCGKCGHAFASAPVEQAQAESVEAVPLAPPVEPVIEPVAAPVTPAPAAPAPAAVKPPVQPGRPGNKAIIGLVGASVVVLGAFAWWLTSRSSATPAANEAVLPEPSAEASAVSAPQATPPSAPVAVVPAPVVAPAASEPAATEIVEREPAVVPPTPRVDEAAQAEARRLKVEEEARQEQARREAKALARQREQDKAKLNQANKTLDDLLK